MPAGWLCDIALLWRRDIIEVNSSCIRYQAASNTGTHAYTTPAGYSLRSHPTDTVAHYSYERHLGVSDDDVSSHYTAESNIAVRSADLSLLISNFTTAEFSIPSAWYAARFTFLDSDMDFSSQCSSEILYRTGIAFSTSKRRDTVWKRQCQQSLSQWGSTHPQWRRQLWGSGARAPLDSASLWIRL